MKKFTLLLICLSVYNLYVGAQSTPYGELLYSGQHIELIQLIHSEVPEQNITGDTARTLAQAYEGVLRYREAHHYYQRWLSADTICIDALNATARMALQLGRIEEGEQLYLRAYAIDSTNFNSGLQLAKLNFQLKNYEQAYNYYYALLLRDTTNISLLASVGDCLDEMGDPYSINFYTEAVELNKENASLAITLINTMLRFSDNLSATYLINRSMEVCDTALVYNPDSKALLRSKGVIYYLMENYPACDTVMSGLIAAGDSTMLNFRYLSLAKYNQELFYDAIPYMEYYYQNDTNNVEAAMLLGISLGRTYDRRRALSLFNHIEELIRPTKERLYNLAFQRGVVYQINNEPAQAAKYYWQAAGIDDTDKYAALNRLRTLYPFTVRQLEEASPEQYARGLFAHVTYLRSAKEAPWISDNDRNVLYSQSIISLFLEDMFFKSVERLQMESPDGKREWITYEELEKLIKREIDG